MKRFNFEKFLHVFQSNSPVFYHGCSTDLELDAETGEFKRKQFMGGLNASRIAKILNLQTLEMCILEHREELEKSNSGIVFKEFFEKDILHSIRINLEIYRKMRSFGERHPHCLQ